MNEKYQKPHGDRTRDLPVCSAVPQPTELLAKEIYFILMYILIAVRPENHDSIAGAVTRFISSGKHRVFHEVLCSVTAGDSLFWDKATGA